VALVYDAALASTHLPSARVALEAAGFRVVSIAVPSGEESKSLDGLSALYDALSAARLDRRTTLVALGGGVTGDLAGFAAATYLRGIDFVQVPTTLLAQVDSSVGGKTGIDLPGGKNLVGAFYQPQLVLIDLDTLQTLPEAEYRAGLAEVVKYGVIADAPFFSWLEANREAILRHEPEETAQLIARCCEIKAAVVGQDEREAGLRAILNYGHTVGHAVEAAAGFGWYRHGEAVSIGMTAAGTLSESLTGLRAGERIRIETLLSDFGLPTRVREPLPTDALLAAMRLDKKALDGELQFVLASAVGSVAVRPVGESEVREAISTIQP
jgi:3-dehydroquinate synthase